MDKWQQIWTNRKASDEDITLGALIRLDGFDTGAGRIANEDWLRYTDFISKKMDLSINDSIFEVGCGSGAFLYTFYKNGNRVGGIDYSDSLIRMAKKAMGGMDFAVCDAQRLQTKDKYDIAIANGVFHYFPDLDYAKNVLRKMIRKSLKTIAILDVPDIALKDESERERSKSLSEAEYKKKYAGLDHLHFKREWFFDLLGKDHAHIDIFDQDIKNYGNSKFRFNVVIKK